MTQEDIANSAAEILDHVVEGTFEDYGPFDEWPDISVMAVIDRKGNRGVTVNGETVYCEPVSKFDVDAAGEAIAREVLKLSTPLGFRCRS